MERILRPLAPGVIGPVDYMMSVRFRYIRKYHLFHGAIILPSAIVMAFFFEDIGCGLAALAKPGEGAKFRRFSAHPPHLPETRGVH